MAELQGEQQYTEDAAHAADILAISVDIAQSRAAAEIYLLGSFSGDGENQTIRRSLYESSLISLKRAFASGSSRIPGSGRATWKIPNGKRKEIAGDDREEFDALLDLANRGIAHRVSLHAAQAEFVNNQPLGQSFLKIKYPEQADLLRKLPPIADRFIQYLTLEFDEKSVNAKSVSGETE